MIPTFTQGQIGKSVMASGGYVLDTVNLCSGLSVGSITGIAPFNDEVQSRYNDGVLLTSGSEVATHALRTTTSSVANNEGCGIEIVFGSAKRVGRIKLSRYGASGGCVCDFKVQAIVSAVPTDVGTVANISAGYTLMDIDCNTSFIYSETTWRVKILNWDSGNTSNMYFGEIEAYEWV